MTIGSSGRVLGRVYWAEPSDHHDKINFETHQLRASSGARSSFPSPYRYSVKMFRLFHVTKLA